MLDQWKNESERPVQKKKKQRASWLKQYFWKFLRIKCRWFISSVISKSDLFCKFSLQDTQISHNSWINKLKNKNQILKTYPCQICSFPLFLKGFWNILLLLELHISRVFVNSTNYRQMKGARKFQISVEYQICCLFYCVVSCLKFKPRCQI